MEVQQWWRMEFSFRNAKILVCFFNVLVALFMIQGFITSTYTRNNSPAHTPIMVKEIEQEALTGLEKAQQKDTKQTAAVDLSKRLKDFRSLNDAARFKGIFHPVRTDK